MDPLDLVRFIKHGSVCLEDGDVAIYVDPYRIDDDAHDADLIIITHSHGDHYSPADIAKVRKADTCFASTPEVGRLLERDFELDPDYFTAISSGSPSVGFECGAMVTALAAENKNHPAGFGFGVLLEFGGATWYLSGDTDVLDEDVECDVLLVCCDGVWNMPDYLARVPAELARMEHRPGLVVPYHYGDEENPGTGKNGARLCAALREAGYAAKEWKKFGF